MPDSMDELDQRLLRLLKIDGREPVVSLGRKLGVSRATVQNRIDRLSQAGTIKGFTVIFGRDYNSRLIRTHMMLTIQAGETKRIIRILQGMIAVKKLYSVTGVYDLIIELVSEGIIDLDQSIDAIREIEGVESTVSAILMSEYSAN